MNPDRSALWRPHRRGRLLAEPLEDRRLLSTLELATAPGVAPADRPAAVAAQVATPGDPALVGTPPAAVQNGSSASNQTSKPAGTAPGPGSEVIGGTSRAEVVGQPGTAAAGDTTHRSTSATAGSPAPAPETGVTSASGAATSDNTGRTAQDTAMVAPTTGGTATGTAAATQADPANAAKDSGVPTNPPTASLVAIGTPTSPPPTATPLEPQAASGGSQAGTSADGGSPATGSAPAAVASTPRFVPKTFVATSTWFAGIPTSDPAPVAGAPTTGTTAGAGSQAQGQSAAGASSAIAPVVPPGDPTAAGLTTPLDTARPADPAPPTVTASAIREIGRGLRGLTLTFSKPMDPAAVVDLRNYTVLPWVPPRERERGPGPDPSRAAVPDPYTPVALSRATYDADTQTVTLIPRQPLQPGNYLIVSDARSSRPLADRDGLLLDGTGIGLADGTLRVFVSTPSRSPQPTPWRSSPSGRELGYRGR